MKIPVLTIETLHKRLLTTSSNNKFILHQFTIHNAPKFELCRLEVYFIALLHKGKLLIETDLTTQIIHAPALYAMAPSVIRRFVNASDDFRSDAIFFDKSFFAEHLANTSYLDSCTVFTVTEQHFIPIRKQAYKNVCQYYDIIKKQQQEPGRFKDDIVRNMIEVILLEIANLQVPVHQNSSYSHNQITCTLFKEHLQQHFSKERKVSFYARLQHLSSKYFSSVIQQEEGRSAGDIIDERVMLEAKALLHKKELTVSQVADLLSFTEASNFGKYFKNLAGSSPNDYRKSLQ